MSEKLCVFCERFQIDGGHTYSEYASDPASIGCDLGHWTVWGSFRVEGEFREKIVAAQTCADYKPAKP